MRWRGRRQRRNVEDRRGQSIVRSKRGVGGGAAMLLIIVGLLFGEDVQQVLSLFVETSSQQAQHQSRPQATQDQNDEAAQFVRTIFS